MVRGIKLLLTALFVGIYAWFVHTDMKQFGLTTLSFLYGLLVVESYVFYLYENDGTNGAAPGRGQVSKPGAYAGKEWKNEEMDV
jgi:hypothetical protein